MIKSWLIQKLGAVRVEIYMAERKASDEWCVKFKQQQQVTDYYSGKYTEELWSCATLVELLENCISGKKQRYLGRTIIAVPVMKRDDKGRFVSEQT